MSVGNVTPKQARLLKGDTNKLWKNYFALKWDKRSEANAHPIVNSQICATM